MPDHRQNQQDRIFRALMHPARREILLMLRGGEECVCHLESVLGYRQAFISQHLAVLREAGLVADRRDGWNMFYRVIRREVFDVLDAAQRMTQSSEASRVVRQQQPDCACPRCAAPATAG